jgi:hypothetical protein
MRADAYRDTYPHGKRIDLESEFPTEPALSYVVQVFASGAWSEAVVGASTFSTLVAAQTFYASVMTTPKRFVETV